MSSENKAVVSIEFETTDMAKQFMAYMSDAGGEWNFINIEEQDWKDHGNGTHLCSGFDYNFKKLTMKAKMEKLK